ncbi:hypothetical protein EHI8A_082660 [Entamoeba histolytica HM-1:IMSS-B]|uniref:Uncharacterized protein n=5 Tax=Entamoeba histolytica TaxID=5759 RepID=C4M160_ENTH1|nr:hypothetical protein EHI_107190 [Entamoeba histolytica HM-1:IMSS]EMH77483.1 hypothetical protein EHI8A_082660 [Entamoeba histolytica HM-1:IMSS-B]EMS12551.1 hypothetical protein KM1_009370 [Entamoeba histolytica HM-3:IMSS]ENY65599.1 hypothetical protein EHI7A_081080 [Entamoeba histolytica HM-1:IMSS-A]GAT94933.1 hypothetical protein CL6EHI_107190 [Entamoeba histolytica]EAL47384.2 hypothetical protein EHI_107190 [Entamoeba histolytica HM-1:IMSS]|eukprot:XP_652770.2 hypothetical protein EHI_107190 [Entamoeba histolytica HM-1:IMSS]
MNANNTDNVINEIENERNDKQLPQVQGIKEKKDKELLKKMKYKSVDKNIGIQSLYFAILSTMGYTLLLEKPKKHKTKTLTTIQLYQLYDQNGICVFNRDCIFEKAKQLNIGLNRPNKERIIRQFILNETINSIIQIIQNNPLVSIIEGRSKKNIVNEEVPSQHKIQIITLNVNGSYKVIDLNKQALTNGKIYHEALIGIFDYIHSDGIIINGNLFNIGFQLNQPSTSIIDKISQYFYEHSLLPSNTFVPVIAE